MSVLWHSVETIATFLLIGIAGYFLARRGWFDREASRMLSRFLTWFVIPVNLMYQIRTAMTKEEFLTLGPSALIPVVSIILCMGTAWATARALRIPKRRRSIFIVSIGCSNTINIGLPINLALFGEGALPAVLVYYMGNTVCFWTVGNYLLSMDSEEMEPVPLLSAQTAKKLFVTPVVVASLIGLALLMWGIPLPTPIANAARHLGGMTTPLSTICIGIGIFETGLANIRIDREILLVCLGRFVLCPLVTAGLLYFMPVSDLNYKVFMIQASLPPMSTTVLLTMLYRTDADFASVAVSFGTLCAIVTVPVYMLILG